MRPLTAAILPAEKTMRYFISSLLATTLLAALAAQAGDIYRWKDANGSWHYADQPVPGAERVNAASRGAQAQTQADAGTEQAARKTTAAPGGAPSGPTKEAVQKVRQDVASTQAAKCKEATEAYDQAIAARRLFKTGANGEPEYLDEDQVEAHRVAARSNMEYLCGK
jgi:hypothetical protein